MPQPSISKQQIISALKSLGLKPGDRIGVHSSLSSFGHVEGGADTVIDAFLKVVGKEGTVVMPTFSTNRIQLELTEEQKKMGLLWVLKALPFDPKETPCWTGKIPDTFWRRKEAVRNNHPLFSLAAIGKDAEEFVKGWNKLLEADGYILLLGVTLDNCSAMHLVENREDFPRFITEMVTPPRELMEKYPAPEWDFDYGPSYPAFGQLDTTCKEHGIMKEITIGNALVKFVRLRELIGLFAEELIKDPSRFYKL